MKFTSKSDSGRISVEILISKFHPNFASKYHSKCGQHFTRFQCRRHYVADIFGHSISPKMSPTFNICRRHLRRHFRRNYQNIGWVHRCLYLWLIILTLGKKAGCAFSTYHTNATWPAGGMLRPIIAQTDTRSMGAMPMLY